MKTLIEKKTTVKQQLSDVLLDISWARLSKRYFGKSSSWIYHKLDGIDGNGRAGEFTLSERIILKNALIDFSERLRNASENIEI